MPQTIPQNQPLLGLSSVREGQTILFSETPVQDAKEAFEERTKKTFFKKKFNDLSYGLPLIAMNMYGGLTQRTLSEAFGIAALSIVTAASSSYLAYRFHKFLINRAKKKADHDIREYIDGSAQTAYLKAQYNYVSDVNNRFLATGHITMKDLGKLVNIRDDQLNDADFRLRITVANAKVWVADYNRANTINQRSERKEPVVPQHPLNKAKLYDKVPFRVTTMNLRYNAETQIETAFDKMGLAYKNLKSGLKDFVHVMFDDPKAKDYLALYSLSYTVSPIIFTSNIKTIIQRNETPDKQLRLPALKPSEYNRI